MRFRHGHMRDAMSLTPAIYHNRSQAFVCANLGLLFLFFIPAHHVYALEMISGQRTVCTSRGGPMVPTCSTAGGRRSTHVILSILFICILRVSRLLEELSNSLMLCTTFGRYSGLGWAFRVWVGGSAEILRQM